MLYYTILTAFGGALFAALFFSGRLRSGALSVICQLAAAFVVCYALYLLRVQLGGIAFSVGGGLLTYTLALALLPERKTAAGGSDYSRVIFDNGAPPVEDIFSGVYIGGAAGSAKTRGVIVPFIKHFGAHKFSGLVFAYKDFELVEYALPHYGRESCDIFAIQSPEITCKINPLDPRYFNDETEIMNFFVELSRNVNRAKTNDSTTEFFNNAAAGVATGVTLLLRDRFPQYCTLPHLASIVLSADHDQLSAMLKTDVRAAIKASTYINSTGNQLSGVQGALSNFFNAFVTPNIFYAMHDKDGDYVDIKVNRSENPRHLFIVNNVANEQVVLPVCNAMLYLAWSQITRGEAYRSYSLIDEGSTLNLNNFSRKPATLRSYENATLFCIQDLSLAVEQAGEATPRAICSNLSWQAFGKINDVKTGEHYEKMFEEIEEKRKSYSTGGLLSSRQDSTTTSKQKTKKYKISDFMKFRKGDFVVATSGRDKKVRFKYKNGIPRQSVEPMRSVTREEVEASYLEILNFGREFVAANL